MSGSDVPYHLRVNKYIERQVFAESLGHIDRVFSLADYAYVSMGGAYLEDFRLVHQRFGVTRLYSFDADAAVITRQKINASFSFIRCECQNSGDVVGRMDDLLSDLNARNAIVWLDFTTPKDRRSQLMQLRTLVTKLGVGDVVKITLNAHPGSLGEQKDHAAQAAKQPATIRDPNAIPPFSTLHRRSPAYSAPFPTFPEWRLAALKKNLGEFCPQTLPDAKAATGFEGLARVLARAVQLAAVGDSELGKVPHRLEPVCSVRYSDVSQMLTVTFVIVNKDDTEFVSRSRLDVWPLRAVTWDDVRELNVPYLSLRERYRIHAGMDKPAPDSHAELGFMLGEDETTSLSRLVQYRAHYLRYPTFAPLDL